MRSLIKNWSIIRFIKLAIGIGCLISFPRHEELIIVFVGLFFLLQALLNSGCGNGGSCPT